MASDAPGWGYASSKTDAQSTRKSPSPHLLFGLCVRYTLAYPRSEAPARRVPVTKYRTSGSVGNLPTNRPGSSTHSTATRLWWNRGGPVLRNRGSELRNTPTPYYDSLYPRDDTP